jgi:hypothetical protein
MSPAKLQPISLQLSARILGGNTYRPSWRYSEGRLDNKHLFSAQRNMYCSSFAELLLLAMRAMELNQRAVSRGDRCTPPAPVPRDWC